jgi:hypothetical protein
MNRGYDGNDIFAEDKNKTQFLEFLEGTAKKMKIRLLIYSKTIPIENCLDRRQYRPGF